MTSSNNTSSVLPSTRTASQERYGVFGNPVAHSQSPSIHQAFAQQSGQNMVYERFLAEAATFTTTLETFWAQGGRGCNITLPFKHQALDWARARADKCEISSRALLAGACNTLGLRDGRFFADNTDGIGLVRDLRHNLGCRLRASRILLLGAGGAAAGALGTLIGEQPTSIYIANRTESKAVQLCLSHQAWAQENHCSLEAGAITSLAKEQLAPFDFVINASSSSIGGQPIALDRKWLHPHTLVYDMMYGASSEAFLAAPAAQGLRVSDGLGMLVEQAAEAFFLWRGLRPDSQAVLVQMRTKLHSPANKGAPPHSSALAPRTNHEAAPL